MAKELFKSGYDGPPQPSGPEYLVPFACFDCRKSWKRPSTKYPDGSEASCPQCDGKLHWMGRKFRTPKQSDLREWKKVEKLRLAGYYFGSSGGGPLDETNWQVEAFPEHLNEVDDWIARNPRHLKRERSYWTGRIEPKHPSR